MDREGGIIHRIECLRCFAKTPQIVVQARGFRMLLRGSRVRLHAVTSVSRVVRVSWIRRHIVRFQPCTVLTPSYQQALHQSVCTDKQGD